MRDAAGNPDDFEKQIEQLRALKPQLRDKLVAIMEASVASFEHFVTHGKDGNGDKLAGFLTSVSMDDALFLTNRSSRAKAKGTGQTELNLDSERAIGLATRFSACGLQANVWQGMATPMADDPSLSELFMRTTVMQDVIYKTVFAIATADFSHGDHLSRAEKAAQIKGVEIDRKMLDKIHASAFDALANVVKFLPLEDEMKDAMLDSIAAAKKDPSKVPANKFAKDIMSQLASEFPVVQELLANVEEHNSHYAVVIHGLLDEYKSADGERRKQLDSDLAVLYREEMRVPEVIAGLTTKTQATRQSHPLAVGSGKKFSEHNLEKQSALVF